MFGSARERLHSGRRGSAPRNFPTSKLFLPLFRRLVRGIPPPDPPRLTQVPFAITLSLICRKVGACLQAIQVGACLQAIHCRRFRSEPSPASRLLKTA